MHINFNININGLCINCQLGKIVKLKYFANTFKTMTRKSHKCLKLIDNVDNFVYRNI